MDSLDWELTFFKGPKMEMLTDRWVTGGSRLCKSAPAVEDIGLDYRVKKMTISIVPQ